MKSATFSVIIPVYRVKEEWLRECLDSVVNQTFSDFEVLIIDDGSTDGSGAVCDEYAEKDSRFRVVHKENGGVSMARNVGLARAKGEWIVFLDCDDWLDAATLAELHTRMDGSDADIVYFNMRYMFAQNFSEGSAQDWKCGSVTKISFPDRALLPDRMKRMALFSAITYGVNAVFSDVPDFQDMHSRTSCGKAYRKAFLDSGNLRFHEDVRIFEDALFNIDCLLAQGVRIMYADVPLYFYRKNIYSSSYRYTPDYSRAKDFQRVFQYMEKSLGKTAEEPDIYVCLVDFCVIYMYNIILCDMAHPDNPKPYSQRLGDLKALRRSEPFRTALKKCRLKWLGRFAKVAIALLRLGWDGACLRLMERRASMRYVGLKL